MEKINLAEKFNVFAERWSPKIVAELNGQYVKLVKLQGEFVWHHHETEDELFLVVRGRLVIKFPDSEVILEPGEFVVVPAGVEHLPVAEVETEVLLLEPKSTVNTGNVNDARTVTDLDRI